MPGHELEAPVWRMLLPPEGATAAADGAGIRFLAISPRRGSWREALAREGREAQSGDLLVVTCEGGLPQTLAHLFTHREWVRRRRPRLRAVIRALGNENFTIERTLAIWPSARNPRIVLESGMFRAHRWLQRSGVLGGGGRSTWKRAVLRSPALTIITYLLPPAVALLARKQGAV